MKSIREVLSPLLIISYVFGLRLWINKLPIDRLKPWFSVSYILIFWLINSFFLKYKVSSINSYATEYAICVWLADLITLLSVVFGMYYNKKFINCLKKLDIVDDTLLEVGITTDYHKLYKQSVWLVLGWFIIVIFLNNGMAHCIKYEYNSDILTAMYIFFINNYCHYINMINDLPSNEWSTWILIHLHLELRRICYEVNSIFGIQMTFKMGYYFLWLALGLREICNVILIENYMKYNRIPYSIIITSWTCLDIINFFLYNYMCETVRAKAIATGNLINRIPYFTYNVEIRENILQLLLQMTQMPVRFYGSGLFQYCYKFLQGFSSSITTVLVLLIQGHIDKQTFLYIKNDRI